MSDCVRVTACRLCDGPLEQIIAFAHTPPGDHYITAERLLNKQPSYPLELMRCTDCEAVQLADTVDPALIYPDYLYTTSVSRGLAEHFDGYAQSVVERLRPAPNALVVDVGSNDGTLLRAFQKRGQQVLGVDPAAAIAQAASASGIPTRVGFFSEQTAHQIRNAYGPAAIVTANHVFANVADLHDFTAGVRTLLAHDGTFVFETGYWPSILKHRLIDTIEHEHIHYFAVAPLVRFFAKHGLRLVSAELQPTKGGSVRGFVRHAAASFHDTSIERLISEEETLTPTRLTQWVHELERLREDIAQYINLKPKHERWVGYGAAVGSTLLLHHFGLGSVLSELWDDNASRHGRFSPGCHLPVTAPNHESVDKIVLLAWRYASMIVDQHPEHAGKWMIPLPNLRFV